MKDKIFTMVGGDKRNVYLANLLHDSGYTVEVVGLEVNNIKISEFDDIYSLDKAQRILIGPLFINENGIILSENKNSLNNKFEHIINILDHGSAFVTGRLHKNYHEILKRANIKYFELIEQEQFNLENAIPSAEGAICHAMQLINETIYGLDVIVLGNGRIGKILSKMLIGLGAKVTVVSRKIEDQLWTEIYGAKAISYNELSKMLPNCKVIFNTAPALVITKKELDIMNKNTLIMDLASSPGGVDFETAKELGIKAILDLGIPGKYSPKTSAIIMKKVIENLITAEMNL